MQIRLVDNDLNIVDELEIRNFKTPKPKDIMVLDDGKSHFEVLSVFSSIGKDGKQGMMLKVKPVNAIPDQTLVQIICALQKNKPVWALLGILSFILVLFGIHFGKQLFT